MWRRILALGKRMDDALLRFFERPRPRAIASGILNLLNRFRLLYVWPMQRVLQYLENKHAAKR